MPNIFGGDQCSKDYAPHMWIGVYFVRNSRMVTLRRWVYRVGVTSGGVVVAERYRVGDPPFEAVLVPNSRIPKRVELAAHDSTFADHEE